MQLVVAFALVLEFFAIALLASDAEVPPDDVFWPLEIAASKRLFDFPFAELQPEF